MTSRDFAYWLQGFFELRKVGLPQMVGTPLPVGPITAEQADMIERHLALVFAHEIDPQAGGEAEQKKLNAIHKKPSGENINDKLWRC